MHKAARRQPAGGEVVTRAQIAARLGTPLSGTGYFVRLDTVETIVREAAQAERHSIFAALEADPGALWRDQGFQEWRKNRQDSDER